MCGRARELTPAPGGLLCRGLGSWGQFSAGGSHRALMPGGLLEGLPGRSADIEGGGGQDTPRLHPQCPHAEGPAFWVQSLWDWFGGWCAMRNCPLHTQGQVPHHLAPALGGEGRRVRAEQMLPHMVLRPLCICRKFYDGAWGSCMVAPGPRAVGPWRNQECDTVPLGGGGDTMLIITCPGLLTRPLPAEHWRLGRRTFCLLAAPRVPWPPAPTGHLLPVPGSRLAG